MRTFIIIILFFFLMPVGNGQSLTLQVVGSAGSFSSDSAKSLSWTVGELMVKTFSDSTNFLTQGFQQPWKNFVVDTQHIQLDQGWSLFSTYINPEDPFVPTVMADVDQDLTIMKNGGGQTYWPFFGVNVIGDLIIGEGYHVKMIQQRDLVVTGTAVVPEETFILIPFSWSILGYLRQSPGDPNIMFSSIISFINIVKDSDGAVFWPQFGLNQIGDIEPGQGYQIKSSDNTSFYYPPNSINLSKNEVHIPECVHFPKVNTSESNLTLGIPWKAWDIPPKPGDEIAVYSNSGVLAGSAVFNNNIHSMPIWGDDSYSNEIEGVQEDEFFYLVIWHSENNSEEIIVIEDWLQGSGQYKANDICIANRIKHTGKLLLSNKKLLCRNYPNPFNDNTRFEFFIPEDSMLEIEILSLLGESVDVILCRQFEAGTHEFEYINSGLAPGTYIYKVSTANQSLTQYLSIIN
ncbi:MAG: T9SS type A sorting domain-containing protein [Bacteroidota bacterium]|nr:T9SS type A sorting domain-containing protein [Bacteroidota bacterium]